MMRTARLLNHVQGNDNVEGPYDLDVGDTAHGHLADRLVAQGLAEYNDQEPDVDQLSLDLDVDLDTKEG